MNQAVYDKAIRLLNIRLHTTGELFQKLKLRKFKPDEIAEVVRELERLKFLDDERFTRIFVENMKAYKDWGYFGIKAKLIKKQVPADIMEHTLEEFFTAEDELKTAKRLAAKLKSRGRGSYEKMTRSLSNRGFRNEVIAKMVNLDK